MGFRRLRAQSAMEYLMTYGWAILIIAVVLGALFSLGLFSGNAFVGTSCVAGPGYLCSNPSLFLSGGKVNLSFTFGQSTGVTVYNIALGCAATSTVSGLPSVKTAAWNGIVCLLSSGAADFNGLGNGAGGTTCGLTSLLNGQTVKVTGLGCTDSSGNYLVSTSAPIGTAFTGSIWLNYTANQGANTVASGSNPVLTAKIATITTRVT